ncbi:MAG: SGNH/GDSL hydrolase family protein [Vicinamibacterales bacterium]
MRAVRFPALVLLGALAGVACGSTPAAPTPPPTPPPVTPDPPAPTPDPEPEPVPAPVLAKTRILAFGDSLTNGEDTPVDAFVLALAGPGVDRSYPFKLQALLRARYYDQTIDVFNGGVDGERAADAGSHLRDFIAETQPQVIIIMHGVNDLIAGVPVGQVVDALEDLVKEAKARGLDVLLSTLPPQNPNGTKGLELGDEIEDYNFEIRRFAADKGAVPVDVYPQITLDMIGPDGLHLTQAGNQRLAEIYFDTLRSLYEQAPGTLRRR